MTQTLEPEFTAVYEGPEPGTELMGITRANFLVSVAGRPAREVAVDLSEPVCPYLASKAGRDDSPEFRASIARLIGECRLRQLAREKLYVDPIATISVDLLEKSPDLVDCALRALAPAQ